MAGGATKVHEASAREHDDALAVGEDEVVHLGLDLLLGDAVGRVGEPCHLNLRIEVPDVAEDGFVLHLLHVLAGDDITTTGGRDEDVGDRGRLFHRDDLVTLHRRLKCANRVDFGHENTGACASHRLHAAFTHVAVASHDDHLAGNHHVGRPLDAVDERLAATVEVVELRLGHRIVHVDGRALERALALHVVETMNAGGRLLRTSRECDRVRRTSLNTFDARSR